MTRSIRLHLIAVIALASVCGAVTVVADGHERRPTRRVEHPTAAKPTEGRRTEPRRTPEERKRVDPRRVEENTDRRSKLTETAASRERKKTPAADSARAREARISSDRRLFRARETMKKQLPGPHYLESRFDVKGKNDKKNLRE